MIDCGGRTMMPGLIDSHVHVILSEVNIGYLESIPLTLMTARAARLMLGMINRGFTTVRDTGGADWGIKTAVEQGDIPGPRLFIAGAAIGPTGGHSDPRKRTDFGMRCHCCNAMRFGMRQSDGVSEVLKSVREQMRQGADHIKIMMSGGVASPYDPLDSLQFSPAGGRGRRAGGDRLRPLCLRPCLYAGSDDARGAWRRARDRARQPDRRADRQADGREGHVHGGEPRRLLRDAASAPPNTA